MKFNGQMIAGGLLGLLCALPAGAQGAVRDWQGGIGGLFDDGSKWLPDGVPGEVDEARFSLSKAYTVELSRWQTNRRLLLGDDVVLFDLKGNRYRLLDENESIAVGLRRSDVGRMTISRGTMRAVDAVIGAAPLSEGNITVAPGGFLRADDALDVGKMGAGGLTILAQGQVRSGVANVGTGDARGTIFVSRGGSFTVNGGLVVGGESGSAGTGSLTIRDDAVVKVAGHLAIGTTGSVELDGGVLSVDSIRRKAQGQIQFQSGLLRLNGMDLAISSTGPLGRVVELPADKALQVMQDVRVSKSGALVLEDGGYLAKRTINNGRIEFRTDDVMFDSGRLVNRSRISGDAEFNALVRNRKSGRFQFDNDDEIIFHKGVANAGIISFPGSTLDFKRDLINRPRGSITGFGTMVVHEGVTNEGRIEATSSVQPLRIESDLHNTRSGQVFASRGSIFVAGEVVRSGGRIEATNGHEICFESRVSGDGAFSGTGLIVFENEFHPSDAISTVKFGGSVRFGALGSLRVDIGGPELGQYDQLVVNGRAEIRDLKLSFRNGYQPRPGDTFEIVQSASAADLGGTAISVGGLPIVREVTSTGLRLIVIPEPSAIVLALPAALLMRRRRVQSVG